MNRVAPIYFLFFYRNCVASYTYANKPVKKLRAESCAGAGHLPLSSYFIILSKLLVPSLNACVYVRVTSSQHLLRRRPGHMLAAGIASLALSVLLPFCTRNFPANGKRCLKTVIA